jgi:hypothetical protein
MDIQTFAIQVALGYAHANEVDYFGMAHVKVCGIRAFPSPPLTIGHYIRITRFEKRNESS